MPHSGTTHRATLQCSEPQRHAATRGSPWWTTPSVMGPEGSGPGRPPRLLAVREREGPAGGSTLITWVGAARGCRLLAQGIVDMNFAGQAPLNEGWEHLMWERAPRIAFAPHAPRSRSGELHGHGSC